MPTLTNLGTLYLETKRHADAEPLLRRALELTETALGARHLDTAASLDALARCCRSLGKRGEAEPLYRRAIAIYEEISGEVHPGFASTLEGYAELLRDTGRNADAERFEARSRRVRTTLAERL